MAGLVNGDQRPIGKAGLASGPLAFGLWRFTHTNQAKAQAVLETALDLGFNLVDAADVYGFDWGGTGFGSVESLLGTMLAAAPHLRDRMVLATKGGIRPPVPYDSSAAGLRTACEDSLRRLGVDSIDLYQVHRPDLLTHPAEVAGVLAALRAEGKVREIGVSNYTPAQYDALAHHLREVGVEVATVQPEFSVAHLDPVRDGTFDRSQRDGVTPLAWSPLGGGRLTTGDGVAPALMATVDRLVEREAAEWPGVDRAAVALAFVLAHPSRPVAIVGSQNTERLRAARLALDVRLDRQDCYDLIQASEGVPLP